MKKILSIAFLVLLPIDSEAARLHPQNSATMKEVVDSTYWIGPKNDSFWIVSKNGYFGLSDQTYTLIVEAKYDRIFNYCEGIAVICKDNLYGALDSTGKVIIAPTLQFLADFQNGFAYGHTMTGDDVLINKKGQNVVTGKNIQILSLKGNYVQINQGVCSLLNNEGEIIYSVNTWEFGTKEAAFWDQRSCPFFTEPVQKTLSAIQEVNSTKIFHHIPDLSTNFPFVLSEGLILVPKWINKEVKFGFIDESGKEIIPFLFDDARTFVNGYTSAKQNNLWGVIDDQGNWVIQPQYQNLESANGSYFVYTQNDLQGVINIENKPIIQAKFLKAEYLFDDLFAFLESNNRSKGLNDRINQKLVKLDIAHGNTFWSWGCMNVMNSDTILPFEYNEILPINHTIGIAMKYDYIEVGVPGGSIWNPRMETVVTSSKATVFSASGEKINISSEEKGDTANIQLQKGSLLIKPTELLKSSDKYVIIGSTVLDSVGVEIKDQRLINDIMGIYFPPAVIMKTIKSESTSSNSNESNVLRYGVNDHKGQNILPVEFEEINIVKTGIIAKQNGKFGFYDFMGKPIVPLNHLALSELRTGIIQVFDEKAHFLNRSNTEIKIKLY